MATLPDGTTVTSQFDEPWESIGISLATQFGPEVWENIGKTFALQIPKETWELPIFLTKISLDDLPDTVTTGETLTVSGTCIEPGSTSPMGAVSVDVIVLDSACSVLRTAASTESLEDGTWSVDVTINSSSAAFIRAQNTRRGSRALAPCGPIKEEWDTIGVEDQLASQFGPEGWES